MVNRLMYRKVTSILMMSSLMIFFQNCAKYGVTDPSQLTSVNLDQSQVSREVQSVSDSSAQAVLSGPQLEIPKDPTPGQNTSNGGGGDGGSVTPPVTNPPVVVPPATEPPVVVVPPQQPVPSPEPPVVTPTPPPVVVEVPPPVVTPPPAHEDLDPSKPFACRVFREVPGFPFSVPARTQEGICYYKKLFDAIAFSNSGSGFQGLDVRPRLDNVLSRGHGGDNSPYPIHPYILGRAVFDFKMLGAREVKLSGRPDQLVTIRVDNFVLVGSRKVSESRFAYSAYGTADSAIYYTDHIMADDQPVYLNPFGAWGTATIGALPLTERFSVNEDYTLNINALDCGGMQELSEIYVVFQ